MSARPAAAQRSRSQLAVGMQRRSLRSLRGTNHLGRPPTGAAPPTNAPTVRAPPTILKVVNNGCPGARAGVRAAPALRRASEARAQDTLRRGARRALERLAERRSIGAKAARERRPNGPEAALHRGHCDDGTLRSIRTTRRMRSHTHTPKGQSARLRDLTTGSVGSPSVARLILLAHACASLAADFGSTPQRTYRSYTSMALPRPPHSPQAAHG